MLLMPNITLSVPDDLKKAMDQHTEINWSEVARQAIQAKIRLLATLNTLLASNELSEHDIAAEAARIKRNVLTKHRRRS